MTKILAEKSVGKYLRMVFFYSRFVAAGVSNQKKLYPKIIKSACRKYILISQCNLFPLHLFGFQCVGLFVLIFRSKSMQSLYGLLNTFFQSITHNYNLDLRNFYFVQKSCYNQYIYIHITYALKIILE